VSDFMFFGSIFIIIGFVFLLRNLGLISGDVWGIVWPMILIIVGLQFLLKAHRAGLFWDKIWKKFE